MEGKIRFFYNNPALRLIKEGVEKIICEGF